MQGIYGEAHDGSRGQIVVPRSVGSPELPVGRQRVIVPIRWDGLAALIRG